MPVHHIRGLCCLLFSALALSALTARAEDPTAPNLPQDTPQVAPGTERPKIRYWLDDPASQDALSKPAKASEATAPGETVIDEATDQPLIVKDAGDYDLNTEQRAARRGVMLAEINKKLLDCKHSFKSKDYEQVIAIARNILTADPRNVAAMEWLRKAQGELIAADTKVVEITSQRRDAEALLEVDEHSIRPPFRYKDVRPHFPRRDEDPSLAKRLTIHQKLDQRIEAMDFMKADLEFVLNTLFLVTGVNIIADPAAIEGKSLTLHVEDLPLRAMLDFIVRTNEGMTYSVTDDAVWITATESGDLKKLMFPRIYPIHYGLVSTKENSGASSGERGGGTGRAGGGGGPRSGGGGRGGGSGGGGGGGGEGSGLELEPSYLETVLKWMKENQDARVFPDGSDYLVDRQSNQLIVYTTATGHDYVRDLMDAFDQPAIQVLIKSRFLDISGLNEKGLGINLDQLSKRTGDFSVGTDTGTTDTTGTGTGTTDDTTDPTTDPRANPFRNYLIQQGTEAINIPGTLGNGSLFQLTGLRTDPQFRITIRALLASRLTKVLSEPQILATNNKEAIIDITQHFSYVTDLRPITTTSGVGNGNTVTNVPAFVPEFDEENIGFTLVVTPSVGRDLKTINLHLNPVVDELASGQSIQQFQQFDAAIGTGAGAAETSIQRPTINQTSLETDVVLEDNGYVIIGGLMRNFRETRERKVPGFSKIPLLGNLFKSKSTSVDRRNLMIIVEAQIITTGGRTYYKEPDLDDAGPREGGVNRSPGQTSEAGIPRSLTAPSLAAQPARPSGPTRMAPPQRGGGEVKIPSPAAIVAASKLKEAAAKQSKPLSMSDMSAQERMERLARAARMQSARAELPKVSANGWSVPAEEKAELNTARGELVPAE
jgi:MSHA biogenesis protein MshL